MLIECQQPRPVPSFSVVAEKSNKSRIALSAICNSLFEYAHQLPESSQVTSPTSSSVSQEQTSAISQGRSLQSSPPATPRSAVTLNAEQHLPSISHLQFSSRADSAYQLTPKPQFPSHSHRPSNTGIAHLASCAAPQSCHSVHPCSILSVSAPNVSPLSPGNSKLPYTIKRRFDASMGAGTSSDRLLPPPYDNYRKNPVSPIVQEPQPAGSHSKRRYSSQLSSRACTNCRISQTRQWVRGENHAWLCHSCGQFWRKNGYPRPRALWNRPTFKRSSRKSRLVSRDGGSRKFKGTTRQTVSSNFLNGKQMIQWGIRLPPLQGTSDVRDGVEAQTGLAPTMKESVEHTSGMLPEDSDNSGSVKVSSWRSLPMA